MKLGWVALPLCLAALVWFAAASAPTASPLPGAPRAPAVVLLEGPPEGTSTDVVVRTPGANGATLLGRVEHAAGSARRAALLPRASGAAGPGALLVVAERSPQRGSTYDSALYRVEGGRATRLMGELTNASSPLVTARGTVLVQRGRDGEDPALDLAAPRALRERTDALALDAVDPATGATRTVWTGAGQIAFLAAALGGDEVAVYHVSDAGAALFALDAGTGAVRPLTTAMQPPLMRDFSFDPARDALVFARAARPGADTYEVASLPAHAPAPGAPRALYAAESDHLMPRALRDGTVVFSLPGERGLGALARGAAQPLRLAPAGDGADAVLGETRDGRWLAVRHTEPRREALALVERASGRAVLIGDAARLTEFVGFAGEGAP